MQLGGAFGVRLVEWGIEARVPAKLMQVKPKPETLNPKPETLNPKP